MNIGYIRVSTIDQDTEKQLAELERYVLDKKMILDKTIEIEISSRKSMKKRKIDDLLNQLDQEDNLIVCEMSRIARSVKELEHIFETCRNKKVNIILVKEGLIVKHDDENPMTRMFLQMLGMFAEFEKNIISARTKEALKSKKDIYFKKHGKELTLGNHLKFLNTQFDQHEEEIYKHIEGGIPLTTVAKLLSINHNGDFKGSTLNTWFKKRYEKDKMLNTWQPRAEWLAHKVKKSK